MAYAKVIDLGGTDKTVIVNVGTRLTQGFEATEWTDLRVGWFTSLCQEGSDTLITGLTQTIGSAPRVFLDWDDRYAIGITDKANKNVFMGFTNNGPLRGTHGSSIGRSKLLSSDAAVGTTNSNYWRVENEQDNSWAARIIDTGIVRATSPDGNQQHWAQANIGTGGPAGYATLSMIRFRRVSPRSRAIRMEIKHGTHSSDSIFSRYSNQ